MGTYPRSVALEAGSLLATLTGIPSTVGTAWALDESGNGIVPGAPGSNNNPYNVEVGGKVATFPTLQAGVSAAAQLIRSASWYQDIRTAITTGNPATIAKAIIGSEWCKGCYNGTTGGANLVAIAGQASAGEAPAASAAPTSPWQQALAALQDWEALLGGVGGTTVSGQSGPAAAQVAAGSASVAASGLSWLTGQLASGIGASLLAAAIAILPLAVLLLLAYKSLQLLTET